jgi:hypothetical protein
MLRHQLNFSTSAKDNATAPLTDDAIGVAESFCIFYGLLFFGIDLLLETPLKLSIGARAKLGAWLMTLQLTCK